MFKQFAQKVSEAYIYNEIEKSILSIGNSGSFDSSLFRIVYKAIGANNAETLFKVICINRKDAARFLSKIAPEIISIVSAISNIKVVLSEEKAFVDTVNSELNKIKE